MVKIITSTVLIASILTASAEPGGTYTLTGQEKSIEEIVRADMEKYPDFYNGVSPHGYIEKFKYENKIGKRKLSPGDKLIFPETLASINAKNSKIEEEKSKAKERAEQEERLARERINSFPEKSESGWISRPEIDAFVEHLDRKGYWQDNYWVTKVDGRHIDGKIEYQFKYEHAPSDGRYYKFCWWYGMDAETFESRKRTYKHMEMVYEQSFVLPSGEMLYQAVWHIMEE